MCTDQCVSWVCAAPFVMGGVSLPLDSWVKVKVGSPLQHLKAPALLKLLLKVGSP